MGHLTLCFVVLFLIPLAFGSQQEIYLDDEYQTGGVLDEVATCISVNDNAIFVSGYTASSLYAPNLGDYDVFLMKLDHNYTLLHGIQWGTPDSDITRAQLLHPTQDIIFVSVVSNSVASIRAFSTVDLTPLWNSTVFNSSIIWFMRMDPFTNSVWAVGGSYSSFPNFNQTNNGLRDGMIIQLDASTGSVLSLKLYGSSGYDDLYAIGFKDSVMYVTGTYNGNAGGYKGSSWIASYDMEGNEIKNIQFASYEQSYGSDVDVIGDQILILGWSDNNWNLDGISFEGPGVWIGSFDANLTLHWMTEWTQFDFGVSAGISNDTIFVMGSVQEPNYASTYNTWVGLLNVSTGKQLALKSNIGLKGKDDEAYAMDVRNGFAFVAGNTNGNYGATSQGGYDIFIQKLHAGNATTENQEDTKVVRRAVGLAIGITALVAVVTAVVAIIIRKRSNQHIVDLPKVEEEMAPLPEQKLTNSSTHYAHLEPSPVVSKSPSQENSQEMLPVTDKRRSAPMNNWLIDYSEIKLTRKIGQGAFGDVYKAKYRGSSVAVKQLNANSADDVKIQDFFAEAELMKGLRPHPNITQLLGVCTEPLCIVTEFVANGSLYAWLKSDKPLDDSTKFEIIRGTAAGMLHLHRQGVIHRDLAARNILLDQAMHPKVADFGLSRVTLDNVTNKTEANVGPVKWMAPEALMERIYNQKTDVWSFGVVIFEVLTRESPYKDYNLMQIGAGVGVGKLSLVPEIEKREDEFPAVLGGILKHCLQFDAKSRPDFPQIVDWIEQNNPLGQSLSHSQQ